MQRLLVAVTLASAAALACNDPAKPGATGSPASSAAPSASASPSAAPSAGAASSAAALASAALSASASAAPAGTSPLEKARAAGLDGNYVEVRKHLEPRVMAGKATAEEVRLVKAACKMTADTACLDAIKAKYP